VSNSCVVYEYVFAFHLLRAAQLASLLLEFSRLGRKFTTLCVCFVVREIPSKQKRGVGGCVVAPYLFSAADYLLSARSRSRKGLFYYYSRRVFVFIWSRGRLFVFPAGERNLQRGGSGVEPNYLQGVNYVSVLQAKRAQPGTHVHARPTRGPQREVEGKRSKTVVGAAAAAAP
jgi:hypothetical protein